MPPLTPLPPPNPLMAQVQAANVADWTVITGRVESGLETAGQQIRFASLTGVGANPADADGALDLFTDANLRADASDDNDASRVKEAIIAAYGTANVGGGLSRTMPMKVKSERPLMMVVLPMRRKQSLPNSL